MRILTLTMALVLLAQFAQAAFTTKAQQLAVVQDVAKQVRRELYVGGYSDVRTTKPDLITKASLDVYYKNNNEYEDALDRADYANLYQCVNSRYCALWNFKSQASMYSGSGETSHFVLLNVTSGKYEVIAHSVYAE